MAFFGSTPPPTSRLEELKRILQRDPTSRQFLALAEEYRRHGKLRDAIITLERGLAVHASAVAAHVALGRIYQQLDRFDDAIRSFTNALRIDRENLVAIRQLAEVHLARGDRLEALKRLKLFRGLNPGDRDVDELILRLESELAPPPERFPSGARAPRDAGGAPFRPAVPSPYGSGARPGVFAAPRPVPEPAPEPAFEPAYRPPPPLAPEPPLETAPSEPAWEMPVPASREAEPAPPDEMRPEDAAFGSEEPVFETEPLSPEPAAPEPESPLSGEPSPVAEAAPPPAPGPLQPPEPFTMPMAILAPSGPAEGIPVRETMSGEMPPPAIDGDSPTAPLVTETLAELYRSQGYAVDAGEVYRTLAASTPDASTARGFEEKADEMTREAEGPRARLRSFLSRLPSRRPVTIDELAVALNDVVLGIPGLAVAALTDREGLAVVTRGSSRNGGATEVLVAELTSFFRSVGRSGAEIGGGPLKSLSLVTEKGTAVLSRVSADYALILQAEPGAAVGEVRWAAARAADRLRPALG
jgi:tetratricopeptide (TPR) repeat protein